MNEGAEAHETRPTRTIAETDLIDQVTIITLWLVLGRSLSSQGVRHDDGERGMGYVCYNVWLFAYPSVVASNIT